MTEYLLSIYSPLVPFDSVTTWVTHLNSLKKEKKEKEQKVWRWCLLLSSPAELTGFPLLRWWWPWTDAQTASISYGWCSVEGCVPQWVPSQNVLKFFICSVRKLKRKPKPSFHPPMLYTALLLRKEFPLLSHPFFSHRKRNLVSISRLKIVLNKCLPYVTSCCLWFFFQQKLFTRKIRSASSRVKLEISKTLSDHWLLVGYSMCNCSSFNKLWSW